MSSVDQKLLVEGEIQIITTQNLGETRGRVLFIDVNKNEFGSFRVFGQYPYARLILDSAGLSSGVAFRTNSRQGSIADGGQGEKYTAEITSSGVSGTYLSLFPPTRNLPYIEQRGRAMMDISRDGTADATNLYNSIATFYQSSWRINEDVYVDFNRGGLTTICMGINTQSADTSSSDTPYIGVATTKYEKPTRAISFNTQNSTLGSDNSAMIANVNGLVAVPQNLYAGLTLEVGTKYALFDRASTNFLILPASSLTFATTGISFLMAVRFTGVAGNNERIFEYGGGLSGNNSFSIGRSGTTNTLQCVAYNTTTQVGLIDAVGVIVQDVWTIICAVYTQTTSTIDLYQDGVKIGSVVCTAPLTDRTTTTTGSYLGRSSFSANSYTSYHLGALYVYNLKLTGTQITSVTLLNYDTRPSTFNPLYSFVGQRLRFRNNEKISGWSGATQSTTARQPTAKVEGFLCTASGASLVGNMNITGSYLVNGQPISTNLAPLTLDPTNGRVGINKTTPQTAIDVTGNGHISGTMDVGDLAVQNSVLVAGPSTLVGDLEARGNVNCLATVGGLDAAFQNSLLVGGMGTFADTFTTGDTSTGTLHLGSIINSSKSNVLMYDTTTKEVSYGSSPAPDISPITLDKVNNRVGINFATPSYTLGVGGDANLATGGVYRINGFPVVGSKATDTTIVLGRTNVVPDASTNAVCIGYAANAGSGSVSIGNGAGATTQLSQCVAIGQNTGKFSQGSNAVAVGANAGSGSATYGTGQGAAAIAIGAVAGNLSQKVGGIAIGGSAGEQSQGQYAVAIGYSASRYLQGDYAISLGYKAGGSSGQPANSISLNASGTDLLPTGTSQFHVKPVRVENGVQSSLVQYNATTGEITYGVPGYASGTVAIGTNAGWGGGTNVKQSTGSVAIGSGAGTTSQGINAVAIGINAGQTSQTANSVAIGNNAGKTFQLDGGIAIGVSSGETNQGIRGVAVGWRAGYSGQGTAAIAIGGFAGETNQHANSIVLNATNQVFNTDGTSRFYVKPVRNLIDSSLPRLSYNATTGEICYGDSTTTSLLPITLDKVNTRVGINKTVPTQALDVNGTISANNLQLQSLTSATKPNVLYYDSTTKNVSYGLPSLFTPSQTKTNTTLTQATGTSDTILVSDSTLTPGWYHITASYQWQLNNNGGAAQNTLKTVFKLFKGTSIISNDCDQPGDYTMSYGTMSAIVEIANGDIISLTVSIPNTPQSAIMDINPTQTFLTITKLA